MGFRLWCGGILHRGKCQGCANSIDWGKLFCFCLNLGGWDLALGLKDIQTEMRMMVNRICIFLVRLNWEMGGIFTPPETCMGWMYL